MAVRKIETEIALSGEKAFNDGMKAMNANLKNLRTDMAAVSAEFDDNANSVAALTSKQKILQESVDQHKEKVNALRQMYEKQVAAYGENSHGADKYRQALNQATVALHKETQALEKNADALRGKYLEGLKAAATKAKGIMGGIGTAAGTVAKGVGLISAASAAGVAAIGAGGIVALTTMASMAREAAEAARAAQEAGEVLTESQQQWLAYSDSLDNLDASVGNAKAALSGILLPILGDLSEEGSAFLNDFTRDMEAAAGDAGKQGEVLSNYLVKGAKLIKEKLPEYLKLGKELFKGLGDGLKESGPELLDIGADLVMELLDGIIEHAPQVAESGMSLIEKLMEGLIEKGPDLLTSAVNMVSQIVMGLAQAAPQLIPMAGTLVTQLILALAEASPQLLLAGLELIYGIISGLIDGLGDIIGASDEIIETIKTAFTDNAQKFLDIGDNIVKKIWGGISAGTDWIYDKISGWVGDVVQWIKDKLGIDGGSTASLKVALSSANVSTAFDTPSLSASGRYSGRNYRTSTGNTINLYFTAKTITEADINMVVDIVNRKLGDDM